MSTSQCAVYQVKDTPEYRDVRFRSYEKLKSEGRTVQIENYQQVYIGRIQPGETPADIKLRLQKQRPKNFKGHSIGCSDVIIITDDGKPQLTMSTKMVLSSFRNFSQSKVLPIPDFPLIRPGTKSKERKGHGLHRIIS